MTPLYHYVGWALLLAMGAVSLSIVGPGLLIAVRTLWLRPAQVQADEVQA